MTTITQTSINIGPVPRIIRFDETVGLVSLLVALGILACAKRREKGSK